MIADIDPKGKGWAPVPHGIIDAAIPDTLKLLLWYCYDKYPRWKYNVTDVARSLDKTPQCIRKHFRSLLDAGVLKRTGEMETKGGILRLYSFHPEQVDAFVKSQLKVNPETDPETDVETDPETNHETGVSHTNTNLPRLSTEKDVTENGSTKGIDASSSPNTSSDSSQAACGGVQVGMPSTSAAHSSDSTTIQYACGNSNAGGRNEADSALVSVSAPMVQGSASGDANRGARKNGTGHSGTAATRAAGTKGIGLTETELDELVTETGYTREQLKRMENGALIEVMFGPRGTKPRNGFDSL
jgi:hypothetical protein